jgi:hypothetical protein
MIRTTVFTILLAMCAAAQDAGHPMDKSHADHAMGFSQDKTTHHFRLYKDGGAIEVEANDPKDTETVAQIRMHLQHIAHMFAEGNFEIPMLVHDQTPPGAAEMKRLSAEIKYTYESAPRGGRVRIQTRNPQALSAVHEFLKFQIREHKTRDPEVVQ